MTYRQKYEDYMASPAWYNLRQQKLILAGRRCEVCKSDHQLQVHHCIYRNLTDCTPADLLVLCSGCHAFYHEMVKAKRIEMQQPPERTRQMIAAGRGLVRRSKAQIKQERRQLCFLKYRKKKRGQDTKADGRRIRTLERSREILAKWERVASEADPNKRPEYLAKCERIRRDIQNLEAKISLLTPSQNKDFVK